MLDREQIADTAEFAGGTVFKRCGRVFLLCLSFRFFSDSVRNRRRLVGQIDMRVHAQRQSHVAVPGQRLGYLRADAGALQACDK